MKRWMAYEAAFPQRTHCFCGKEEGETHHAETLVWQLAGMGQPSGAPKLLLFQAGGERLLEAIHLFIVTHNLRIKQSTSA